MTYKKVEIFIKLAFSAVLMQLFYIALYAQDAVESGSILIFLQLPQMLEYAAAAAIVAAWSGCLLTYIANVTWKADNGNG